MSIFRFFFIMAIFFHQFSNLWSAPLPSDSNFEFVNSVLKRVRRFTPFIGKKSDGVHFNTGNNSPVHYNAGGMSTTEETNILDNLGRHTNRLFEGATNAILTPINWLSNTTRYWLVKIE